VLLLMLPASFIDYVDADADDEMKGNEFSN
jgi:hypothetical protein